MPNRFLIIVTILTVIFTAGVVSLAFGEVGGSGNLAKFQSTAKQYWRKAKNATLDAAAPMLNTFGVNVDKRTLSPEDSEVSKYLEEASQAINSAMKSISR